MLSIHQEQTPLVRSDVERLLQEARNSEQSQSPSHYLGELRSEESEPEPR